MSDYREVAVEVTIAAPIEVVWRALRDRDQIRRWHGWDYDQIEAEIEEIYFSAATESDGRALDTGGGVFELEDHGPATVVRVVMAAPPDDDSWHGYYDDIRQGWTTFVHQLRFLIERHHDDERRTVYVSGPARAADQPGVLTLLGLADAASREAGARYRVTAATGDELAGEVWFRSEHQLGLSVDGWNDGLLVVTDKWTPDGAAGAILSTYGLDPGTQTALRDRWQEWWGRHFQDGAAAPGDEATGPTTTAATTATA